MYGTEYEKHLSERQVVSMFHQISIELLRGFLRHLNNFKCKFF